MTGSIINFYPIIKKSIIINMLILYAAILNNIVIGPVANLIGVLQQDLSFVRLKSGSAAPRRRAGEGAFGHNPTPKRPPAP
jgi:hypothetical protein